MTPHRPPGRRPAAPPVRTLPHVHNHREDRKPASPPAQASTSTPHSRAAAKRRRIAANLPTVIPAAEAAIVDAIERSGRPVTAGELSAYHPRVAGLDLNERNDVLRNLVARRVLECQTFVRPHPRVGPGPRHWMTFFGFPHQFAEWEGEADGR